MNFSHAGVHTDPKDSLETQFMIFNCMFYIWGISESTD